MYQMKYYNGPLIKTYSKLINFVLKSDKYSWIMYPKSLKKKKTHIFKHNVNCLFLSWLNLVLQNSCIELLNKEHLPFILYN